MHKNILIVVGITILFLGLAIQPSIATVQPKEETIGIEPKDYLFQTIIDIANNPDVKNLFEQYKYDLLKVDIDRSVYRKLLLRNPRLFRSIFFAKPSLSYEYLDKTYNNGIEITNLIGEDKALEIIESIWVTDKELFNEFFSIIRNNEELSGRLAILEGMNKGYVSDLPFDKYPIICSSLFLIAGYGALKFAFFLMLSLYLEVSNPIISRTFGLWGAKSIIIWFSSFVLLMELECIESL